MGQEYLIGLYSSHDKGLEMEPKSGLTVQQKGVSSLLPLPFNTPILKKNDLPMVAQSQVYSARCISPLNDDQGVGGKNWRYLVLSGGDVAYRNTGSTKSF